MAILSNYNSVAFFATAFLIIQANGTNGIKCGGVKFAEGLVRGGTRAQRTEWPFIAALYQKNPTKFFCGGTIISHRHVLTGNFCMTCDDSE